VINRDHFADIYAHAQSESSLLGALEKVTRVICSGAQANRIDFRGNKVAS